MDVGSSLLNTPAVLAAVLYALVSVYVTGPLLGERLIAKQELERSCNRGSQRDVSLPCNCAVGAVLEKHRISFGIMAGTVRLITPAAVSSNLRYEYFNAARSPQCRLGG